MPFRANLLRVLLLGLFLSLGACASRQDTLPTTVETSQSAVDAEPDFDDYDDDDAGTADPFESWNRVWFGFNDTLMRHVLDPAYRGYSHIVPEKVREEFPISEKISRPLSALLTIFSRENSHRQGWK